MSALQEAEREMETNRAPGPTCAGSHIDALIAWAAESGFAPLLALSENGAEAAVGFVVFGAAEEFGCFVAPENQRYGVISDLFVAPEARRRGVGTALLRAARTELTAAGLGRIEIGALAANAAARRLYEREGFRPATILYDRIEP